MTMLAFPTGETALKRERVLFKELFFRLIDALLNRIFDLRPERAARRMAYFIFLLLFSGFLIALRNYPLMFWAQHLQSIFLYLFNSAYAASYIGNPFTNFFFFAFQAMTDPRTLQYLPIFLAPFFLAIQSAAIYLADIFEIEDVAVARKFVSEVALSGSDETIRITQGDISDEHRTSPNYLIGGPGKVIVDIDSVALFEKPDGTTRVIGPTGKEPGGKATLDGFERYRQAIDLRDHFIELRDQDSKSSAVKSRSSDGIPITATDVRFMFSVHREEEKSNRDKEKSKIENPYPFNRKAIEQLVYKATSRVTPDMTNPSAFEFSWVNNMISLIRGRLGGFMSERELTRYLASIGMPEFENAKYQEEKITEQVLKLAPATQEDIPKGKDIKPPPEFTPRYEITNLFAEFADEFTKSARDRGVKLHWIGVGTWHTPIELVPEKHLEAWKLSRENLAKGSKEALESFENEVILLQTATLIRDVPVAAYQTAVEEQKDYKNAMQALLLSYRQQLIEGIAFMRARGEVASSTIIEALKYMNSVFGHWVDKTSPPPTAKSPHISRPIVIMEQAYGFAHIKDLPLNKQLRVGQSYHLQVDILRDLKESSIPMELLSEKEQAVDIVIQADGMNIYPDWFREVVITPNNESKSLEFTITPNSPGSKDITIQYYYKSHWLTQIKYQVEVLKA